MSEKIFIKPNTGADGTPYKVRLPLKPSEFLPVAGDYVVADAHWLRRINDGSVVVAEPVKTKKAPQE